MAVSDTSETLPSVKEEFPTPPGFLGHFRKSCGVFVNNEILQNVLQLLIIVNAIVMALLTFNFVDENPNAKKSLNAADRVFLYIFTVESSLQLMYYGLGIIHHRMHMLDILIVIVSWVLDSIQVLRSLRIFRTLRLFQKSNSLKILLQALADVIPHLSAIGCLLLLILYVFAVMFTDLFKSLPLETNYFRRLDVTLFSLFQFMTLNWVGAARECQSYYSWAPIPIMIFVYLSGFIIFNLVVAVLCNALLSLGKKEEKEMERKRIEKIERMEEDVKSLLRSQIEIRESLALLSQTHQLRKL